MIDKVLDAVIEFDLIETRKRAMRVTELKSHIMQWATYLERTLTKEMYDEFIRSLERPEQETLDSDAD